MEKRYRLLRLIATLWKILAWLLLISGLLGAVGVFIMTMVGSMGQSLGQATGFNVGGPILGVSALLGGFLISTIYFIIFYTFGEVLNVLIQIEENTRAGAVRASAPLQPAAPSGYNPSVMETPPPPYVQ